MSHTPGPWDVRRAVIPVDGEYDYAIHADGQVIAEVFGRTSYTNYPPAEANARLISAAPKLLTALKSVVDEYGPWHDDDCPGDDTCDCSAKPIHDAVNAAIAQAEGR